MSRLTLVPGQPFPSLDVALTDTLADSDIGVPGFLLNLAGRPPLSLYDVFNDGTQLLTAPMPMMEMLLTGAPIGGMTANGGLTAAFDGNLSKPDSACAKSSNSVVGFALANSIGLALSSSAPVTRILLKSPSTCGFLGGGQWTPWQFVGSFVNDITTATIIANGYAPPSSGAAVTEIEARFPNGVPYPYVWLMLYGNGINNVFVGQLQPFSQLPMSARGLTSVAGLPCNAAAIVGLGNSGPVLIPAQSAKYRGTILISETAGRMRSTLSYGLARMMPIWNWSDRRFVELVAGYAGQSGDGHYQYIPAQQASFAFGPAMGNPQCRITIVNGLAEGVADVQYEQTYFQNDSTAATAVWCAPCIKNSGDALASNLTPFGSWGEQNFDNIGTDQGLKQSSRYALPPFVGGADVYAGEGVRGNVRGFFGEANQRLTVCFEC